MGNLGEDSCTVPRGFFAARGTPVLQVAEDLQRLSNDLVRGAALSINHESKATGIMFLGWIV